MPGSTGLPETPFDSPSPSLPREVVLEQIQLSAQTLTEYTPVLDAATYFRDLPEGAELFSEVANAPIFEPHNHCDVAKLASNEPYKHAWDLFGSADHYIWSVMRQAKFAMPYPAGINEALITGGAEPEKKWTTFCTLMPYLVGNPVHSWTHMSLGILGIPERRICAETADELWHEINAALKKPENSPRGLLEKQKVMAMCTTDDPCDTLEHHQKLQAEDMKVYPTFRPDSAWRVTVPETGEMNPNWNGYIDRLASVAFPDGKEIESFEDLMLALKDRHDFFQTLGCKASDFGIDAGEADFSVSLETNPDDIFKKARSGAAITPEEANILRGAIILRLAKMDEEKGYVTQIHLGPERNMNGELTGPNQGGDAVRTPVSWSSAQKLINTVGNGKFALYTVDPAHFTTLAGFAKTFGGRVKLGEPWWHGDNLDMMIRFREEVGGVVPLALSIYGMTSDARGIVSYAPRHKMSRIASARYFGEKVRTGQISMEDAKAAMNAMAGETSKIFFDLK